MIESNFDFLKTISYHKRLTTAEELVFVDASCSGTLIRKVLEAFLYDLFHIKGIDFPEKETYKNRARPYSGASLLNAKGLKKECPKAIIDKMWLCYNLGNTASHPGDYIEEIEITIEEAFEMLEWTHNYLVWYVEDFVGQKLRDIKFDKSKIPTKTKSQISEEKYNNLFKDFEIHKAQLNNDIEVYKKENDKLKEENSWLKKSNEKIDSLIEKSNVDFESAGITEQVDLVWGRVFVNFKYRNQNYFGVKYFKSENGATEKCQILKGRFETSWLYTYFKRMHPNLAIPLVEQGKYDSLELLNKDTVYYKYKAKYGTPSTLIKQLKIDINTEMLNKTQNLASLLGQDDLNIKFDYTGAYYKCRGINYRSQLKITKVDADADALADLLVVMINPGASYAFDVIEHSEKACLDIEKNDFVKCKPDDTQYQISRLMIEQNWNNAIIINLFDICDTKSTDVINRYTSGNKANVSINTEHLDESIFKDERRTELNNILNQLTKEAPILLGWGVSEALIKIKKSVFDKILEPTGRKIIGIKKNDFQYYHPWPRGEYNENKRLKWVETICKQLN